MFSLKVIKVLNVETHSAKSTGRPYKVYKLLCDSPYFHLETGVHPSSRIIFAASAETLEIRKSKGPIFVFVSQGKKGIWINGMAS